MLKSKESAKNNLFFGYLAYVLWPFAAFMYAVKKIELKEYRILLLFFAFYFGYNFIVLDNSDGSRVVERLTDYANLSILEFVVFLGNIYTNINANPDFYLHVISYIVSKFTLNPHFFTAVLSVIYFFVFFKLIAFLKTLDTKKLPFYTLVFLSGIVIIYPFTGGINGVRFPLATIVYTYAFLKLVFTSEKKYLFWALSAVLIHWSFLFPSIVILIFQITKNTKNYKVLLIVFIVSYVFSAFILGNLSNYIGVLGNTYEDKFDTYSDENYLENRNEHFESLNLHIRLAKILPYYFTLFVVLFSRMPSLKLYVNEYSNKLYLFTVYFSIAAFILGGALDPINNRYIRMAYLFTLVYVFYLSILNKQNKWVKRVGMIFIPIFLLQLYTIIRTDILCIGPNIFVGNWLSTLLIGNEDSIFTIIN